MQEVKLTASEIKAQLAECTGTERYHRHFLGLRYTDGIKMMADLCGAFWLIDTIASYQRRCQRDPMLQTMQFWFLRKQGDGTWLLYCERDMDDIALRQKITYSDFPLDEVQIWVQEGVILLPSEY